MQGVAESPEVRPPNPSVAELDSLKPGQKLGRYTLLTPVGQGGMARVWAARQTGQRGFQKMVAIKTIMPNLAADEEFERMFLDEARIASSIHHPNVCEILDLGEEGNVLFLAMEWVDGTSLLSMLKARPHTPLPDLLAVRIVADACAGLHAAHELRDDTGNYQCVVHRDVSPHNILIAFDGNVKVADFGVAKAMNLDHAPTMAGQLKGKVAYMSPEQAMGDLNVDRRSDIFSLGAVLYEALTGRRAWPGANDVTRLQNLLSGNLVPPRQIRADLPIELEHILARSLAMDPNQRFQTAEQMRLALEQFLVSRNAIVTPSDVGRLIMELASGEIEERRLRIRAATTSLPDEIALIPPSQVSLSVPGVAVSGPRSGGMRRSTATAILVLCGGITVAGLLGIVAIGSIPTREQRSAAELQPSAAAPLPPPPSASAPAAQSEKIVIIPKPDDATVELNGITIGVGRQQIDRPKGDASIAVVIKAPGFVPSTVILDENSAAERAVELAASPTPPTSVAPTATEPPAGSKKPPATTAKTPPASTGVSKPPATSKPPTGKTPAGKQPAIPANPY